MCTHGSTFFVNGKRIYIQPNGQTPSRTEEMGSERHDVYIQTNPNRP